MLLNISIKSVFGKILGVIFIIQVRWTKYITVYWPWQGSLKRLKTSGFLIISMALA